MHEETDVGLSAALAAGWARATCSGPVKASLLFRQYDSAGVPVAEAGVNATTVPAKRFVTFAERGAGPAWDRRGLCQPIRHGGRGHLYSPGRDGADAAQRHSDLDAQ